MNVWWKKLMSGPCSLKVQAKGIQRMVPNIIKNVLLEHITQTLKCVVLNCIVKFCV